MLLPGSDRHEFVAPDAAAFDDASAHDLLARLSAAAPAFARAIGEDPLILHEGVGHLRPATAAGGDRLHAWYDTCRRGRHSIAAHLLLGESNAAQAARALITSGWRSV